MPWSPAFPRPILLNECSRFRLPNDNREAQRWPPGEEKAFFAEPSSGCGTQFQRARSCATPLPRTTAPSPGLLGSGSSAPWRFGRAWAADEDSRYSVFKQPGADKPSQAQPNKSTNHVLRLARDGERGGSLAACLPWHKRFGLLGLERNRIFLKMRDWQMAENEPGLETPEGGFSHLYI